MTPPTYDKCLRVYRGGSWSNTGPAWVGATLRYMVASTYRNYNVGFRTTLTGRTPR